MRLAINSAIPFSVSNGLCENQHSDTKPLPKKSSLMSTTKHRKVHLGIVFKGNLNDKEKINPMK